MQLVTKTLDLPNTLNHDILRRHADQPTIHDILLYLAKRWYSKAYENDLLFSSGTLAAMLTNYEMKKKEKEKKQGVETTKTIPSKIKKVNQLKTKTSFKKNKRNSLTKRNSKIYI